jgi:RND family efflux transporter MFP subunit
VRSAVPEPSATTMPLSRGDVVDTVGATGTLEAVETVDVGTQVSGVVQALYADFNSIVRKGQVIARLDPQLIQTQIEQQKANVARADADLERLRVALADAEQKLRRAQQMAEKNLIPRTELETAEVNVRSAEAQIRSSEAALTQARAQLNNQVVNLGYTTITAPIDGIVISRNVDQGQTVASSMNAPTLYVIAADLTKMQVIANIDEADVGRMRPGQVVNFRVDAYPTETFRGEVAQVRLQPSVVQNVVTYSTVISVPNPELKLKPGMTANVTIEIARRNNVLRVPNRALSFRPTNEMFAALNQEVPPELQRGPGMLAGRGGRGGDFVPGGFGAPGGTTPAAAQSAPGAAPAQRAGRTGRSPGRPSGRRSRRRARTRRVRPQPVARGAPAPYGGAPRRDEPRGAGAPRAADAGRRRARRFRRPAGWRAGRSGDWARRRTRLAPGQPDARAAAGEPGRRDLARAGLGGDHDRRAVRPDPDPGAVRAGLGLRRPAAQAAAPAARRQRQQLQRGRQRARGAGEHRGRRDADDRHRVARDTRHEQPAGQSAHGPAARRSGWTRGRGRWRRAGGRG